jgi:hypothetical protein
MPNNAPDAFHFVLWERIMVILPHLGRLKEDPPSESDILNMMKDRTEGGFILKNNV